MPDDTTDILAKLRRHGMLATGCNVYAQVAVPGMRYPPSNASRVAVAIRGAGAAGTARSTVTR